MAWIRSIAGVWGRRAATWIFNRPILFLLLLPVNFFMPLCVSKIEMSPLTAKLKCPHGRGKDIDESEAVTEVSGDGFG
jgi:hypothetical protein